MEEETLEILDKISESTDKQNVAVIAVSLLCFACFVGYLFYKVLTCLYKGVKEEE